MLPAAVPCIRCRSSKIMALSERTSPRRLLNQKTFPNKPRGVGSLNLCDCHAALYGAAEFAEATAAASKTRYLRAENREFLTRWALSRERWPVLGTRQRVKTLDVQLLPAEYRSRTHILLHPLRESWCQAL